MYANVSIKGSLARLPVLLTALALTFTPHNVPAQEADGEFEGERNWTDKDGKTHEVKAPNTRDSKVRKAVTDMRSTGKPSSDSDQELFDNWAQSVVRPLTWKENIATLPEIRKDLKKYLIQWSKGAAPDLHDRLNSLTLQVCTEAIKDARYPRPVRINCILMLADLDEREHNAGTQQEAVPLPGATTALVELLADEKQPLPIRIESTIALMRHVQPAMPAALQGQAAEALQKIMTAPISEAKGRAGQIWLRFRASDLLLAMLKYKLPVDQAALSGGLAALLSDENLPFWARAVYAGDLGKLDGKSLSPDKISPTVQALNGLALAILQSSPFMPDEEEAEDTGKKEADAKPSRDTGGRNRETASGKRESDADKKEEKEKEEISPVAQKLLSEQMMWQLARIRGALYGKEAPAARNDSPDAKLGLYSAASDADKAAIKTIVDQIDKCVKALIGVPDDLEKVADTLRGANQELEGLVPTATAEPRQTATADDEEINERADNTAAGNADKKKL